MEGNFVENNVIENLYKIASESDGIVILTYSLNLPIIHEIISRLKPPKDIRIMYSIKTNAQKVISQLGENIGKRCRPVELFCDTDHFDTTHAKIYLFCKTKQDNIKLTVILGSFNLTHETLKSVEIYGVYEFNIHRDFLDRHGIKHFLEIFDLNGQFNVDLNSLKQNVYGEYGKIGYDILLLLLQIWFKNLSITEISSDLEDIDFFKKENVRIFVSTLGKNTLLIGLQNILKSAFIFANESEKEVELTIVMPFHTQEAIEKLFLLKDQILENINLKGKIKFSIKFLTNSFNVSTSVDKSSFTNPAFLRKLMFEQTTLNKFRVKFWGYMPGNEDFIHAKVLVFKVGDKRVLFLTSANLTLSGFGFGLQKNLEVGIIENHPEKIEPICKWVDECWDSEYTIVSIDDRIWNELQNWYDRLEEMKKVEEDFEIKGLTDKMYVHETNVLEVKDKKGREIESMKLIMSFPRKEKPVRNLEETFKKRGEWFYIKFKLEEKHLGPVFCNIIVRLNDGSYIFVVQQKINVIQKFPDIKMSLKPNVDVPIDFLNGTIPIEVEIEIGKGISKVDLTKISFELLQNKKRTPLEIILMKEKIENSRKIQFLLLIGRFKVKNDAHLALLYKNEKKAVCKLSREFLKRMSSKSLSDSVISFLKNRSVVLLTDRRTLCPRIKSEIKLNFDSRFLKSIKVNKLRVIRDFNYSELIGMERVTKQYICETELKEKINLDNDLEFYPPADVTTWFYGVKKEEWVWWIPLGKLNYQLLKNPPELEVKDKTPIKTNVTPIKIEFYLTGLRAFKDQVILDYEIGEWRNSLSTQCDSMTCILPENLNLEKLEKGITLRYRFIFKYNVADIVGKIHIKYDFFISSPHPNDPTKTKMLVYNPKEPHKLLDTISREIPAWGRLFFTVIPTRTTSFKTFGLQLDDKDFEKTKSYFTPLKDGVFALRRLDQEILNQFQGRRNIANFRITLTANDSKYKLVIPFDILYLEGVETNSLYMRKGGYGKTITIYHPDEYKDEFKEDIIRIVRMMYSKHLEDYHIGDIRKGKYAWIVPREKEEEIIGEIRKFIKEVKSENFIPYFTLRTSLHSYQETTLEGRRVIDFILFIRRTKHELGISINESLPSWV